MIVQLILWRIIRIVSHEPVKLLLTKGQIIQFILEDDARIIQSLLYHLMSCRLCLFGEWYLSQIILSLMWIIDSRIQTFFFLLLGFFYCCNGIALFVCHHLEAVGLKNIFYNSLIIAAPIIDILTFSPQALETLLTLQNCLRIIEIPCCRATPVHNRHRRSGILVKVTVVGIFLLQLSDLFLCLRCLLFFLFFAKFFYHSVNSSISRIFIHNRKFEKRILQLYSISIWHQLIQHLRTV